MSNPESDFHRAVEWPLEALQDRISQLTFDLGVVVMSGSEREPIDLEIDILTFELHERAKESDIINLPI